MSEGEEKVYLGDGAYALMDRWGNIVLTTEDGYRVSNTVVLEPQVWNSLVEFVAAVKAGQ